MSLIAILGILLVVSVSVFVFFRVSPQIGGKAAGSRLAAMNKSPNYVNGKFQNSVPTNMDMGFSKVPGLLLEYMDGSVSRVPEKVVTRPFERSLYAGSSDGQIGDILVTWFGHSSILLRTQNVNILIDPVFTPRASMFSFMGPKRFAYTNQYNPDDLPDQIDIVLLSHDHYDHLDYETIKEIKDRVGSFYVPLGVGAHLEKWGIAAEKIKENDWWSEFPHNDDIRLAFTPSRHFSGRGFGDRFNTLWGSWVIQAGERKLFFSGDSGYFPGFAEIGSKYGPFDLAFVECGAYNERWADIHMIPEESAAAGRDLQASLVIPIHWGKFNLALHSWTDSVERILGASLENGVSVLTPAVGRSFLLSTPEQDPTWWRQ